MTEINYKIYSLNDPITGEVRYIGLTFNSLKQRLKSHCSEKSKTHKCNWINNLREKGLKPIIELIEENISSYDDCCKREIFYIETYKNNGHNLTNSATGGNKNKKMSLETCEKMSRSRIEYLKNNPESKYLSEETKLKISESTINRFKDPNEKDKLRISNKKYEDSKSEEQKLNDILVQERRKEVYQYDKNMNLICKYPSISNAAKMNNLFGTNISKCCNHKVKSSGGFIWRFEDDFRKPTYKYM
jgi:group I intron endonuclease